MLDGLRSEPRCGSPLGADDAWPSEPVRELIEAVGSRELENGSAPGRLNKSWRFEPRHL